MKKWRRSGVAVFGFGMLAACGPADLSDIGGTPDLEDGVGKDRQAVESAYDAPVAAAIELTLVNAKLLVVFACDVSNTLKMSWTAGFGWAAWETLASDCRGVPTVGKWPSTSSNPRDSLFLYSRFSDDKLWELYWPNATQSLSDRYWSNVSNASLFGTISGSPTLATSAIGGGGSVDVIVREPGTNALWDVNYRGSRYPVWAADRVYADWQSKGRVFTANTVSARGLYLAGRGLTETNDTTGWTARFAWPEFRVNWLASDPVGGTPFPAVRDIDTGGFWVARFGNELRHAPIGTNQWVTYTSCTAEGSPRGPTMATGDPYFGFVRSGTSPSNDLVVWNGDECHSVGGYVRSGVTAVEHGTASGYRYDAIYKGYADKLYYYRNLDQSHTALNLTLP